ncbi:MAG: phosphodiester glycosidase family protein [Erysipelotrichaceae bacterium]|nr:phosphodiester glycosidase family protein [Erysipelotrichaceae bacterium]
MESELRTYKQKDNEIIKTQIVSLDSWNDLCFVRPKYSIEAFKQFCYIYEHYIIASFPYIFAQIVLFTLPEDEEIEIPDVEDKYGEINDPFIKASIAMNEGVKISDKKPIFRDEKIESFYKKLEEKGLVKIVSGKRKATKIIPVSHDCGFMSQCAGQVKVNSSFFIMDFIDVATVYDLLGTPLGLMVKDGKIISPPLFEREALLVDEAGKVSIRKVKLEELKIFINGKEITGKIFERPYYRNSDESDEDDIVIIGDEVKAVKRNGACKVPSSGFVLRVEKGHDIKPGDKVEYKGLEGYRFGVQVGCSAIVDGIRSEAFLSPFYDLRKIGSISFPPSLYPLNYKKSRAARILLGSDKDDKPVIVWAEGPGKFGHQKGLESAGASLSEMAMIGEDVGLVNAVNLDGGGSAQILLEDERFLRLTDRNKEDDRELERAVPVILTYR